MILLRIENPEAYLELQDKFNLTAYHKLMTTIRIVVERLLVENDEVQILMPKNFLARTYQSNLSLFATALKRKCTYHINVWKHETDPKLIIVRAGFLPAFKFFIQKVLANLQNPGCRALDILKHEMPASYREQPFVLKARLEKNLGEKIRVCDLGDSYRFSKAAKVEDLIPRKKKRRIKKLKPKAKCKV